jgi:hypothetical protein
LIGGFVAEANSLAVLRIVLALCKTYDVATQKQLAKSRLYTILFQSETLSYFQKPLPAVLTSVHLVTLTIIYLHYLCFDQFPDEETLKYVLTDEDPFILNWELISQRYSTENSTNNSNLQSNSPTLETLRNFFEEALKLFSVRTLCSLSPSFA